MKTFFQIQKGPSNEESKHTYSSVSEGARLGLKGLREYFVWMLGERKRDVPDGKSNNC